MDRCCLCRTRMGSEVHHGTVMNPMAPHAADVSGDQDGDRAVSLGLRGLRPSRARLGVLAPSSSAELRSWRRGAHSHRVANEKPTAMKAMPMTRFHWSRSLKTGTLGSCSPE